MKRLAYCLALVTILAGAAPGFARAQCADCPEGTFGLKGFEIAGWLKTYFLWANDSDFDSKAPLFNEYGQSVGFVAASFSPMITWQIRKEITFRYWPELTGSVWSRTEAAPRLDAVRNQPYLLNKELWVQATLPESAYFFRLGIQDFADPTAMYLKGFYGAFRAGYEWGSSWIALTALQVPDTVYEGISFDENNFENDNYVFSVDGKVAGVGGLDVMPGLYVQWDRTLPGKTKILVSPCLTAVWGREGGLRGQVDLVFQTGVWEKNSIGNRDTTIAAGAVQAHASYVVEGVRLEGNLIVFTPDDNDPYNGLDSSFQYSGYAKSATLVLSENDLFDQYNNLDEAAAASKAGLALADLKAGWMMRENLELFDVIGYGLVLQKVRANGGTGIGLEEDLGLRWAIFDQLQAILIGGVVVPGLAGSALANELGDLRATDPMYYFQGSVVLDF